MNSRTHDYFFQEGQPLLKIKEFQNAENQKEDLWYSITHPKQDLVVSLRYIAVYVGLPRNLFPRQVATR